MVLKTRCIEKLFNVKNVSCAIVTIIGVHHITPHHMMYIVEICLGGDSVLWVKFCWFNGGT